MDDSGLLSRAASGTINARLKELEDTTGYHVNVITVRKLVFEQDPFAFGDKVLETWYPTLEEGNNKGNLLLVKNTKEGAIVGGPAFLKGVGNDVLDSILSKNIPINLEDEKYGEALTSSVDRIVAALEGKADPGLPGEVREEPREDVQDQGGDEREERGLLQRRHRPARDFLRRPDGAVTSATSPVTRTGTVTERSRASEGRGSGQD